MQIAFSDMIWRFRIIKIYYVMSYLKTMRAIKYQNQHGRCESLKKPRNFEMFQTTCRKLNVSILFTHAMFFCEIIKKGKWVNLTRLFLLQKAIRKCWQLLRFSSHSYSFSKSDFTKFSFSGRSILRLGMNIGCCTRRKKCFWRFHIIIGSVLWREINRFGKLTNQIFMPRRFYVKSVLTKWMQFLVAK